MGPQVRGRNLVLAKAANYFIRWHKRLSRERTYPYAPKNIKLPQIVCKLAPSQTTNFSVACTARTKHECPTKIRFSDQRGFYDLPESLLRPI
jgi:hypothetical protein